VVEREYEPGDGRLIRVTITVRIARKVEMRPKDKARVSLVETME
jgi:hypothetical protein